MAELLFYRSAWFFISLALTIFLSFIRFGALETIVHKRHKEDRDNPHIHQLLMWVRNEDSHVRAMVFMMFPDLSIACWLFMKASNLFIDRYVDYAKQKSLTDKLKS